MKIPPKMLDKLIMYHVDYTTARKIAEDIVTVWYRSSWGFKKKQTFRFRMYKDNKTAPDCEELIAQLKERMDTIEIEYNERTEDTKVPKKEG